MNKKSLLLPIAGFISIALAGCSNNGESAGQARHVQKTQPLGYYSNEKHHNGNARILDDNDGPVTEIMDHSFGSEGKYERNQESRILQVRDENGNPENPTKPLATKDRNFFQKDNRYSTSDVNYHGHLDGKQRKLRSTNDTVYEVRLADKIDGVAATIPNVQDVHCVVYKNNVLVAVDVADVSKEAQTRQKVLQAVQPYLKGRSVNIVTDEATFSRIRDIENNIRGGRLRDGIDMNIRDIFDSVNNQSR
ncbi:YhcN/YlaJ family sporulation lipoprotein [Bacillus sp. 1NLA3E]|uniref:YhcN/YlaJ family sporulation lipoprotein n=1 Tax=Bacillus sp. 1NLA3E TaxID=666686 RepID=UPI000247EBC8|nr:YhcN/YlaJ family sporulation lipoprotein [Bacillus sp. 1NLA3E]AGK55061.1 spore cortex protein CoxA [Bacillus sp. 1NLA3E]